MTVQKLGRGDTLGRGKGCMRATLDRMRLSRKGPPAIGFLLTGRRAMAGVAALRSERRGAEEAGLKLNEAPTMHPIDRLTALAAARDVLGSFRRRSWMTGRPHRPHGLGAHHWACTICGPLGGGEI